MLVGVPVSVDVCVTDDEGVSVAEGEEVDVLVNVGDAVQLEVLVVVLVGVLLTVAELVGVFD